MAKKLIGTITGIDFAGTTSFVFRTEKTDVNSGDVIYIGTSHVQATPIITQLETETRYNCTNVDGTVFSVGTGIYIETTYYVSIINGKTIKDKEAREQIEEAKKTVNEAFIGLQNVVTEQGEKIETLETQMPTVNVKTETEFVGTIYTIETIDSNNVRIKTLCNTLSVDDTVYLGANYVAATISGLVHGDGLNIESTYVAIGTDGSGISANDDIYIKTSSVDKINGYGIEDTVARKKIEKLASGEPLYLHKVTMQSTDNILIGEIEIVMTDSTKLTIDEVRNILSTNFKSGSVGERDKNALALSVSPRYQGCLCPKIEKGNGTYKYRNVIATVGSEGVTFSVREYEIGTFFDRVTEL